MSDLKGFGDHSLERNVSFGAHGSDALDVGNPKRGIGQRLQEDGSGARGDGASDRVRFRIDEGRFDPVAGEALREE